MRVSAQRGLAHPCKQVGERGIARKVRAQHQRVDEETDQPLEFGAPAPGNGRAHRDVILPAVAMQQYLEGGQQRHEQRRPFAPAKLLERLGQWRGQIKGKTCALVAGHWRAEPVGGQLQRGQISEFLFPVSELPVERLTLQPVALPYCVVSILEIGSLGRLGACPLTNAVYPFESSRHNTPIDQPSETM